MTTTVCPVKVMRDEGVGPYIELYHRCHRVHAYGDVLVDERVAWPVAGGVLDQPARVIAAFDVISAARRDVLKRRSKGSARPDMEPDRRSGRRRRPRMAGRAR